MAGPSLEDGRIVDVANVVWATGYRPAFDWVHLDVFDQEGQPVHDRGITAEPGLYFIGLFFLTSAASSLVGGVGRDAEHIARHIAARARQGHQTRGLGHCAELIPGTRVVPGGTTLPEPWPLRWAQTGPSGCRSATPERRPTQNDGALCDVRTPRRQRCSKKLSFMHR